MRSFFASGTPYLHILTPILTHLIDFLTHQVRIFFTSRCQIHAPAFPSKTSFQHFITSATADISRNQNSLPLEGGGTSAASDGRSQGAASRLNE